MSIACTDFLVSKSDLHSTQCVERALPALAEGEVLLKVDRFAFTANNITYAVLGESMAYWQFFPAPEGWGRVPVWGFAEVIESRHAAIQVGERVYGYLPMSTHLVMQPGRVKDASFVDASAHRTALPAVYNHYSRVLKDLGYDAAHEAEQALLRPLFTTSFLIDDFLADHHFFGAEAVVLSSASSKTALGTAFQLKSRGSVEVIGLTSARNQAFTERSGCYHRVLPYFALATLPVERKTIFVDMAGNGQLLHDVHHHFGDALVYSCLVGGTHWQQHAAQHSLPGAKPTFFFSPTQVKKRSGDWGSGGLEQRLGEAWGPFVRSASQWMTVVERTGLKEILRTYLETLRGSTEPDRGVVLRL